MQKLGMIYQIAGYTIIAIMVVYITYFIEFTVTEAVLMLAMFTAGLVIATGLELAE